MTVTFPLGSDEKFYVLTTKENYHLLEFNIAPDNRFTPETCPALVEALTYIANECDAKPLITTSTTPKFYSNGLDFERAISTPGFFDWGYYAVMRAMLEFPWPTIALVNGHGFAAGFTFAMCHDFRVMNPDKGFLCMNEIEFGAPMPPPMMEIMRAKTGAKLSQRIMMFGERFPGKIALKEGIVDALGDIKVAEEFVAKVARYAKAPSYGVLRQELFRTCLDDLYNYSNESKVQDAIASRQSDAYEKYYESIEKNKPKL